MAKREAGSWRNARLWPDMSEPRSLFRFPLHLGLGASATAQPEFSGMAWYATYAQRHGGDGAEGRLVSLYTFDESWTSWEMHPAGAEVVVCTAGAITLIQQSPDGNESRMTLCAGDYAINPPGVWHTADISAAATALFITSGLRTEHRPR
jgi:quercetin dioxygenase-like cupin family protein